MVTTFVALVLISDLNIEAEARLITVFLGVMAIVGAASGATASIMLIRGIIRPIRQLTDGVAALGRGDADVSMDIRDDRELNNLARTILAMDRERRETEAQLQELAHYDPLTGLPNRTLFHLRLSEAIANSERTGQKIALQLLDLDDFKIVNDTLGHPAGDELLKEISRRLLKCIRDTDTVARLGGDEFAIIQNHLSETFRVEILAQRVIDSLHDPVHINGDLVQTGTSVGITIYPDDATEADELLRSADLALYHAKRESPGSFYLYDLTLDEEVKARTRLENDLRKAIDNDEFHLVYQPKSDLATGAITGAEALIRWQQPERGMVSPGEFIPVAEQAGLIPQITEFVLRQIGRDTADWPEGPLDNIRISVNLSALDLKRPNFVDWLHGVLQRTNFEASNLELEITEYALVDNVERTRETLESLRENDIELSVDDFGTGYSSLSYLKHFPLNYLKIDRSFIQDITKESADVSIATSVITMAHGMGMRVIAEGVETEEQATLLRNLGCDQMQGYYLSFPLLANEFLDYYLASIGPSPTVSEGKS
ncbi:MAG: EAL domain-containing protein [Alphaproteobacteria bacterium]